MNYDEDFAYALSLQHTLNADNVPKNKNKRSVNDGSPIMHRNRMRAIENDFYYEKNLVDPTWEYIDPTPDIHVMFMQFNARFFWNALQGVEVRWSPRMTSCAGVCCYEGRGGLCSVRLSAPLLKLRPRKDLVQTMLHEMIHAYLFVTDNNKDRDGHGPEFLKHMFRINKEAGTNITVYHNFIDEVKSYQNHWWRCNGACQKRPPYFGMVKRSMNRAPGPNDIWWADHQNRCGGEFIKVKSPDGSEQLKSAKTLVLKVDIRKYFKPTQEKGSFYAVKKRPKRTYKSANKKLKSPPVIHHDINCPRRKIEKSFKPLSQNTSKFPSGSTVVSGGSRSTVITQTNNKGLNNAECTNRPSAKGNITQSNNKESNNTESTNMPSTNPFEGEGFRLKDSTNCSSWYTLDKYGRIAGKSADRNKFECERMSELKYAKLRRSQENGSALAINKKVRSKVEFSFKPGENCVNTDTKIDEKSDALGVSSEDCVFDDNPLGLLDDEWNLELKELDIVNFPCPSCGIFVPEYKINNHLDDCLSCDNKSDEN